MSIVLIVPFYNEQEIQRKAELDTVLAANICNGLISKIVLVADETIPENLEYPFEKVIIRRLGRRCTFSDLFYHIAPNYSEPDDIVIISNGDIKFDDTLSRLKYIRWESDIALACSRWDKYDGEWRVYPTHDSQDFWIFKGPIKGMYSNFPLGKPGSDNRIAWEMDNSGYWVFNVAKDIRGFHIHESLSRNYTRAEVIPEPYKLMHPTDLSTVKMIKPKKILHIGMYAFMQAEGSIGEGLQSNGDYKFIDWTTYCDNWRLSPDKRKEFENRVLNEVYGMDICFMQIQTENIVSLDLIRAMKKYNPNIIIYNWTGDVRENIPKCFTDIASDCVSLFTNATDVEKMKDMGFKSEYLQIGFPEKIYCPRGYMNMKEPIVFMANNYYDMKEGKHSFPLGKERQDMVMFLKENYGDKFGVYGNGWSGLESGACVNDGIQEASIYRGAAMAINYSHFNYKRYSSDRLLRIMGSGCFCISHNYPEIEKDFEVGKHLAVFNTLDELKNIIDHFLSHPEEAHKIAKEGCEYVHKTATWKKRIQQLLKMKV